MLESGSLLLILNLFLFEGGHITDELAFSNETRHRNRSNILNPQ
ncbi:hypothetical protein C7S15_6982 [Burkholderia cepacia]|nr:hypothetical protein [Burkholderia cepacia]